jgi:hypothetical protein
MLIQIFREIFLSLSKSNMQDNHTREKESITQFPPELQEILQKLLPASDPLDNPKFDHTEYINLLLPSSIYSQR